MDDLDSICQNIFHARAGFPKNFPTQAQVASFIKRLMGLFFPHFSEIHSISKDEIKTQLTTLLKDLETLIVITGSHPQDSATKIVNEFSKSLSKVQSTLIEDAKAICAGDPAAKSVDEVIIAYPGFLAIAIHRVAHQLLVLGIPIIPRILSEFAHQRTGIDIHPGAKIGSSFVIDHGTGIVVGETTVIEDNVKLYQGVTLGALSVEKSMATTKRHPTIETGVVIYANATILGGETVVGANSVIGGNVWLTASVPPNSTVYHKESVSIRPGS